MKLWKDELCSNLMAEKIKNFKYFSFYFVNSKFTSKKAFWIENIVYVVDI